MAGGCFGTGTDIGTQRVFLFGKLHSQFVALSLNGVWWDEKGLRRESEAGLCSADRHRSERPSPQWIEAVAAFERDDRTAEATEREAACKPRQRISHTAHRRPAVTAAQRRSFTRYRSSSRVLAHATAGPAMPMHAQVRGGMERPPTCYSARMEGACFCYRSASDLSELSAVASPPVQNTAAERTVTGAGAATPVTAEGRCAAKLAAATRAASIVAVTQPTRKSKPAHAAGSTQNKRGRALATTRPTRRPSGRICRAAGPAPRTFSPPAGAAE